ncbi:hypothetical protein HII36_28520 [Nonomuraea sp. NN258]|uniref:DUF7824 domain-containing protein n=1 Tax=Nonomuraea antri TaxID=2730852 RepID=UPI00156821BD|nr:DUF6493 family protein [Nonomuraea antri]NRQ35748.1 hypothetical protein [Nonomuraea antri]
MPPPLPPAPQAGPIPQEIRTPEALAELPLPKSDRLTSQAWLNAKGWLDSQAWLNAEIWLDAFVRLTAQEPRERMNAALARLARRCGDTHFHTWPWHDTRDWAAAMARELAEPGADPMGVQGIGNRLPKVTHETAGRLMPLMRYAEVYEALCTGALPPYLLATPTRANGLLDADALVERLEGYERAGVSALRVDLRQALLRLGRTVSADTAARARRLTSDAGRRVAGWLTDRPADPQVVLRLVTRNGGVRIESEFVSGPEHREALGDLLVPRFQEESCERLLAVLAGHRDLAAARAAWSLRSGGPLSRPTLDDLHRLTVADGPGGPGVALIAAHFLVREPEATVWPLLKLAAGGGMPGEELGRQLAELLDQAPDGPSGVLAALREVAERGAYREIWEVMRGLLPGGLPGDGERATVVHTRMMTLAADTAEWAGATGELTVVAELAGRRRGSDLVSQARRLHEQLTTNAR